ncbi:DUF2252 domain-containing protein [Acidomonas methanolica]|uniref:DUF2252 domain-containing protein n=1 Tax=Acidomonas methanolica TaxID=437 RepID=UPI002119C3AD|nr:DUF2252 domain-containing protein [Acidomonas methanolica]MCQ9154790.1 DUF2252 domain-containing protein [Acidomonas methanolica]
MRLHFRPQLPRAERYAAGQALRHLSPRRANAEWSPPKDRIDPLNILIRQGAKRLPKLLPVRYARMRPTPLTFLRGAAAVMASDLARTANAGIFVQSCGDCHLNNFGTYATPEGVPVFDINDFDETAPAPFEWDLKRLSTSLVLAGGENGYSEKKSVALAASMAANYVTEIAKLAELPPLQAWNARINLLGVIDAVDDRKVREQLRARLKPQLASFTDQFGMVKPGPIPTFRDRPPLVVRLPERDESVRDAFARYLAALPQERRILLERYTLTDIVFKVVGVGSVGTFCAIGLFSSSDGEALLLQIKEAGESVLEEHLGSAGFANHGERVVVGQRIMQAASDAFLGWTRDTADAPDDEAAGRHFYVRQVKDARLAAIGEHLGTDLLPFYARLCGQALARAHARSADLPTLAGYLGRGRGFSEAIAGFGKLYAEQTREDWKIFVKAIADGTIHAA